MLKILKMYRGRDYKAAGMMKLELYPIGNGETMDSLKESNLIPSYVLGRSLR